MSATIPHDNRSEFAEVSSEVGGSSSAHAQSSSSQHDERAGLRDALRGRQQGEEHLPVGIDCRR